MKVVAGPRAPSSEAPIPGLAVRPTEAVSTRDNSGPFEMLVFIFVVYRELPDIHRPRHGNAKFNNSLRVG